MRTNEDKKLKEVTSDELNLILQKVTAKARFDKELDTLKFSSVKNELIKKEEKKIILEYMSAKKKMFYWNLKSYRFRKMMKKQTF